MQTETHADSSERLLFFCPNKLQLRNTEYQQSGSLVPEYQFNNGTESPLQKSGIEVENGAASLSAYFYMFDSKQSVWSVYSKLGSKHLGGGGGGGGGL